MNRREYVAARRSLRNEFLNTIAVAGDALRQRLIKKATRRNGLNQRNPRWGVILRKNVYLHLRRLLRNRFYIIACASRGVRNPSAFVEKTLARIDAYDEESRGFPMTARDWLQI